jgi:hypothetical protein
MGTSKPGGRAPDAALVMHPSFSRYNVSRGASASLLFLYLLFPPPLPSYRPTHQPAVPPSHTRTHARRQAHTLSINLSIALTPPRPFAVTSPKPLTRPPPSPRQAAHRRAITHLRYARSPLDFRKPLLLIQVASWLSPFRSANFRRALS